MQRNVGEISHGDPQGRTYAFILFSRRGFWAGVEIRVKVCAERFRIPDVVIVRGGRPSGRIITARLRLWWKFSRPKIVPSTSKIKSTTISASAFPVSG